MKKESNPKSPRCKPQPPPAPPQLNKWQIICSKCYREHYCGFALTAKQCILFRPKDKPGPHYEYILTNK